MYNVLDTAWLTINRKCNFSCLWCYGEKTCDNNDMSLSLAMELIELLHELGVKKIILTGGEPTIHKNFFDIINYIEKKKISTTVISNGYMFCDDIFVANVLASKLQTIRVSIKAGNKEQFIKTTKHDSYENIRVAIKNLAHLKVMKKLTVHYSITISKYNIHNIEQLIDLAMIDNDFIGISLSFGVNQLDKDGNIVNEVIDDPKEIINLLWMKYPIIHKRTKGKIFLAQTYPDCMWPKDFLTLLNERKQLRNKGCGLTSRRGLVFDVDGTVIPCDFLWLLPLGKYKKHFNCAEEFINFWQQQDMLDFYKKISQIVVDKPNLFFNNKKTGGCPVYWLTDRVLSSVALK